MKRILFTVLASSISSPFHDERERNWELLTNFNMAAKDWRNLEELEIVSRFDYSWTVEKYIRWLQNTEIEEITIVVHTHSPRAAHTESR